MRVIFETEYQRVRRRSRWTVVGRAAFLASATVVALQCTPRGQSVAPAPAAVPEPLVLPEDTVFHGAAPDRFRVRFETSQGPFIVEVTRAWSPLGVDRFYHLARSGYFDRQKFFRVRARFIAQFGLHPDPRMIAAWKPSTLPDETPRMSNVRGTLAYAMLTTANTRSTQIFINLADNGQLDAEGFAPFGLIIQGIEVIDRLYAEYDERAGGGMRAGNQGPIEKEGNSWFEREFPKLDSIVSVRIVR